MNPYEPPENAPVQEGKRKPLFDSASVVAGVLAIIGIVFMFVGGVTIGFAFCIPIVFAVTLHAFKT